MGAEIGWRVDLVFSVDDRMVCVLCMRGPQADAVSFKVDTHRLLELTGQPGIAPASCCARAQRVQLPQPDALFDNEIRAFIRRSYAPVRARRSRRRHEPAD
jgi:predicted DNA-binding protein (MmcQ/YjbR family)